MNLRHPVRFPVAFDGTFSNPVSLVYMDPSTNIPCPACRRDFLTRLFAGIIGTILGLVPFAAGFMVLLDPLRRKASTSGALRVTTLEAVPDDGVLHLTWREPPDRNLVPGRRQADRAARVRHQQRRARKIILGVKLLQGQCLRLELRQDRCDLSLFRLGLRLLARCLKDHIPIPNGCLVPLVLPMPFIRTFQKQKQAA